MEVLPGASEETALSSLLTCSWQRESLVNLQDKLPTLEAVVQADVKVPCLPGGSHLRDVVVRCCWMMI